MQELLREILAPGVTLRAFFLNHCQRIHESKLEDFREISSETVRLAFSFDDVDERYTIELRTDGFEVEDDEMVDFPVATIHADGERWEEVKPDILEMALALEASQAQLEAQYGRTKVTRKMIEGFERFDGTIGIEVTGLSGGGSLSLSLSLNDYVTNEDAPSLSLRVSKDVVMQMARGELGVRQVEKAISFRGDAKFGVNLAGYFSQFR